MNKYKFEKGFNIKCFVIVISVLLLVSYGIFNARNLLLGPTVEIFSPANNTEAAENIAAVSGVAKNITSISLNEKPIFVDKEGMFQEKLLLNPGSNTIQVKAQDRFRNEVVKIIKIYYKQSTTTADNLNIPKEIIMN
jgi:hypothetical protein